MIDQSQKQFFSYELKILNIYKKATIRKRRNQKETPIPKKLN